jgi:hypothetical protein
MTFMDSKFRYLLPVGIGIAGAILLSGVYFGLVSWAESPKHAAELLWQDRWLVLPILLGFGVQAALYSVLKLRLFLPQPASFRSDIKTPPAGASLGAGGSSSAVAMAACCAHHITDVLPVLGLTAAATFLANYQRVFMAASLAANLVGIVVMLAAIFRARKAALGRLPALNFQSEEV